MKTILLSLPILLCAALPAAAQMKAQVLPPWDGKKVPAGQHCSLQGGNGSTPPIQVTGMPSGTTMIVVEYNDKSFSPLSSGGGHGIIGYQVSGTSAKLPAVPGMTQKMPRGVVMIKKARTDGKYASDGYLPPCSGGRGNRYVATVKAISDAGKVLSKKVIRLGRY